MKTHRSRHDRAPCEARTKAQELESFVANWPRQLAVAEDFQEARSVVTDFIAHQSRRQREELDRLERQKRNEGSTAVDDDGRRLDRRGFDAAKTSRFTLASFQAGHFRRTGRYATKLEDLLPASMAGLIEIDPAQITVNTNHPGDEYWMYTETPANFYFEIAGRRREHPAWLYASDRSPVGGIDSDDWRHVVDDPAHVEW